jgi:hypothetical protein
MPAAVSAVVCTKTVAVIQAGDEAVPALVLPDLDPAGKLQIGLHSSRLPAAARPSPNPGSIAAGVYQATPATRRISWPGCRLWITCYTAGPLATHLVAMLVAGQGFDQSRGGDADRPVLRHPAPHQAIGPRQIPPAINFRECEMLHTSGFPQALNLTFAETVA